MGDEPYWRSEEFAVHLSCKLDSETHPRIKAFSLTACRLEAVSLAGMGKADVSFIFLKKGLGPAVALTTPDSKWVAWAST